MKKKDRPFIRLMVFSLVVCVFSCQAFTALGFVPGTPNTRMGVTVAGGNGRGNAANQLAQPNGIFVDKYGNVWVADTHNFRVQKWTPGATAGIAIGAGLPDAPDFPVNVFVDNEGNVYVADYFNGRVVKYSFTKNKWTIVAGKSGEMDLTRGVWVDVHANVYATDYGNNRVLKYSPGSTTGVVVAGGNDYGDALNQLANPTGVFVRNGVVYVTDQGNARIMKWNPGATEGIIVAGGNGEGDEENQINHPIDAHVDQQGNVYITDNYNNRIQKWEYGSTCGFTIAGGNGAGSAANQLNSPYGSIVDANGFLYVADHENDRIQRFDLNSGGSTRNGITVAGGNGRGDAPNQLNIPNGAFVDDKGNVWVTDPQNYRTQKWTPGATEGITLGEGLDNYPSAITLQAVF